MPIFLLMPPTILTAQAIPKTPVTTTALGIFQSDIIIRTAILSAISDLRTNPWLLDYVFASLPNDDATAQTYGQQTVDRAKEWFSKTEIPVTIRERLDDIKMPIVTITLSSSEEAEFTLADVHYNPSEVTVVQNSGGILTTPFAVESYDPKTGSIVLPDVIANNLKIFVGMNIVDSSGHAYPIQAVGSPIVVANNTLQNTIQISPGIQADFSQAVIQNSSNTATVNLESVWMKETYQIGCHVSGEPEHLIWLHSIIVFILLRYKQSMLEARGFERSTIKSSDLQQNEAFDNQVIFSRGVNITGYARNYWPKAIAPSIQGVRGGFKVTGSGNLPTGTILPAVWIGDKDTLG